MKLQVGPLKAETIKDLLQASGLQTEGLTFEKAETVIWGSSLKVSNAAGNFVTCFASESIPNLMAEWNDRVAFLYDTEPIRLYSYKASAPGEITPEIAAEVLKVVQERYGNTPLPSGPNGPTIFDADHQELSPGSKSIVWEGAWEGWTEDVASSWNTLKRIPGVFVEPINHWSIGIYWIGE